MSYAKGEAWRETRQQTLPTTHFSTNFGLVRHDSSGFVPNHRRLNQSTHPSTHPLKHITRQHLAYSFHRHDIMLSLRPIQRVLPMRRLAAFSTTTATQEAPSEKKGFLARKYDEYSIGKQQARIIQAEQLFRFAQMRADDP